MRGSQPGELLRIVVALLEHQVLPSTSNEAARSTLMLSVGMLDNLAVRVQERSDLVQRDHEIATSLLEAAPDSVRRLRQVTDGGHTQLRQNRPATYELIKLLRALWSEPDCLNDPEVDGWMLQCQAALRQRMLQEVELLSPTRYLRSQNA